MIDYLWGHPTALLLGSIAKGFRPEATRRTRLIEIGESAGKTISLPGSILLSTDLTLMGSGFGSVPLDQIMLAIPTVFSCCSWPSQRSGRIRPLADVEKAWSAVEKGKRIVFSIHIDR